MGLVLAGRFLVIRCVVSKFRYARVPGPFVLNGRFDCRDPCCGRGERGHRRWGLFGGHLRPSTAGASADDAGASDPRVPVGEAIQMRQALSARSVPNQLIIFPDEGHVARKRGNQTSSMGMRWRGSRSIWHCVIKAHSAHTRTNERRFPSSSTYTAPATALGSAKYRAPARGREGSTSFPLAR
jgi:hypothetical protein